MVAELLWPKGLLSRAPYHRNRTICTRCIGLLVLVPNDDVVQHVSHTPANTKSCGRGLQRISLILDFYMYVMVNWQFASITWVYCRFRFRVHQGHTFFSRLQLIKSWFSIGSRAHVGFICCNQGRVVQKLRKANPWLKAIKLKYKIFLYANVFDCSFGIGSWCSLRLTKTEDHTA